MKIALAQINSVVGDFKGNYAGISGYIEKAQNKKADLIVFPELSICGYPPQDLVFKKNFVENNKRCLKKISGCLNDNTACVVGFVEKKKGKLFNSAAFLSSRGIEHVYSKLYLPNYSVFDEKRYFSPGTEVPIYEYGKLNIHLSICEDIWKANFSGLLEDEFFPDITINISASPYYAGKFQQRKQLLQKRAKKLGIPVVYVNLVGGQDELVFDGGSLVVSSKGEVLLEASRFKEDLLIYDSKKKYFGKKRRRTKPINKTEEIHNSLILGIRDYMKKNDFEKVVVGVSGGIDSAVTLALTREALGKNNVVALVMPSVYTSKCTFSDSVLLCERLGVEHHVLPIDEIYDVYLEQLDNLMKDGNRYSVACQNIQARIRGNILMGFSNRFGYLVANTGNKSELSVGYCTLYGDMVGGVGVLADVYKNQVYKLARFINRKAKKSIIPRSILTRVPSAELKPNQKDEDDLPSYKVLDRILELYIEQEKSKSDIMRLGFKKKTVEKIIKMVDKNEYKRRQSPPGIKITPKYLGKDRRMPIVNKFSE